MRKRILDPDHRRRMRWGVESPGIQAPRTLETPKEPNNQTYNSTTAFLDFSMRFFFLRAFSRRDHWSEGMELRA